MGALIQLGNCFDLMDTRHTEALAKAYPMVVRASRGKARLPVNRGDTPDKKLRRRDCAVLNYPDCIVGVFRPMIGSV